MWALLYVDPVRPASASVRPKNTPVSQGLRFIVFGVPRSGTKGLVRALNLHPNVLCASERLDTRVDHARVRYPEDVLAPRRLMDPLDRRKLAGLQKDAASKEEVLYVGNKIPRYYFALQRINQQLPGLRNLCIYRSPRGFIPSWNRREQYSDETRWHAGEVGLFGVLELLVCLQNVSRQPGAFIFPYNRGLNESVEPILAALDFIGADPSGFDETTFLTAHLPKKIKSKKRLAMQPHELELLEALRIDELDELLSRRWGAVTPGLGRALSDYLRAITPVVPGAIDEAFRACDNSAARYFGARHMHVHREELVGLLDMTKGSRFIADIQRFNARRRLRYLYLQRSLLTRRLTGPRLGTPADDQYRRPVDHRRPREG